jgi:hypothetical protein
MYAFKDERTLTDPGDPQKLQKVGVKTIVDLPGVGLNFQDHYLTFSGEFTCLICQDELT